MIVAKDLNGCVPWKGGVSQSVPPGNRIRQEVIGSVMEKWPPVYGHFETDERAQQQMGRTMPHFRLYRWTFTGKASRRRSPMVVKVGNQSNTTFNTNIKTATQRPPHLMLQLVIRPILQILLSVDMFLESPDS